MPKEKDYIKPANTFIDQGITVRAKQLYGSESVRIDGLFIGDINLDGHLQIGETGRIVGDLEVSYALVAGVVEGNILCRATVQLSPTARVLGDVLANHIIIDEGAVFHGMCKTRDSEAEIIVV